MDKSQEIRRIAFCPHCGNRAPQRLVHVARHLEKAWSTSDGSVDEVPWGTFVAECETCGQVLVYDNTGAQWEGKDFHHGDLLYPRSAYIHHSVPQQIRKAYEEAYRIKEIAPNAFAVQIRRALEAICDERGARAGSLRSRLILLTKSGQLPEVLSDVGDAIRLLGNIGAHGINVDVHIAQVIALDELFRAVVEYLYVLPYRLRAAKKGMQKQSQEE